MRFALGTPGTCFRREQAQWVAGWSVQPKGLAPVRVVRAHGQTSARCTLSAPPPPPTSGWRFAMAVAEARHHSSRGQTTATPISEVEEQETTNAPRQQKALPPGMRSTLSAEPQVSPILERHVAEQVHDAQCRSSLLLCRRWRTSWTC